MIDFVFPNNNEEEFIKIASKLSYKELCFVYNNKDTISLKAKINKLQKTTKIKLLIGINIKNPPFKKPDVNYTLLESSNKNHAILERGRFNILYNAENLAFNHILCKLAKKNNISLGFSFSNISKNKTKSIRNAKTNLRLCKKYKVNVLFASFASDPFKMRNYYDLKSFFDVVTR